MESIKKEDLSFHCNYNGYQILYRGIQIGGAGTISHARKTKANLNFQKQMAEMSIRDILNGRIPSHMKKNIKDIQSFDKEKS